VVAATSDQCSQASRHLKSSLITYHRARRLPVGSVNYLQGPPVTPRGCPSSGVTRQISPPETPIVQSPPVRPRQSSGRTPRYPFVPSASGTILPSVPPGPKDGWMDLTLGSTDADKCFSRFVSNCAMLKSRNLANQIYKSTTPSLANTEDQRRRLPVCAIDPFYSQGINFHLSRYLQCASLGNGRGLLNI